MSGQRLRARMVLGDASACVFDLTHTEVDDEHHCEWRIKYFAAVGLLRAVRHLLNKVDCERFPQLKSVAESRYRLWRSEPEHMIFRGFIDNERNALLKEYRFLVPPDSSSKAALTTDGGQVFEWSPAYLLVESGPWQELTVDELLWGSVEWWQNELSGFERLLKQED